jgi:hypothetical protein
MGTWVIESHVEKVPIDKIQDALVGVETDRVDQTIRKFS